MIPFSSIKEISLLFLFIPFFIYSQGPGSPRVDAGDDFSVSCSNPCVDLTATYFETGNTTSYSVDQISYYPYSFQGGYNTSIVSDDIWSEIIFLDFDFCFFDGTFDKALINSNGALTFSVNGEVTDGKYYPNTSAGWPLNSTIPGNNGTYQGGASDPRAVLGIFGVLQDTNPQTSAYNWSINYEYYGSYPNRAMVFSWNNLGHYACNLSLGAQTYQMVLYETTNVIEIYVKDRQPCTTWWSGVGAIGIQNADATQGYAPPGRNTGDWSAHHEAWRFTPNGPSNVEIIWKDDEGTVVGNGATINVCVEETTTYTAQAVYTNCTGETATVQDQVTVTPLSDSWVDFGPDIYTCDDSAIVLDANPNDIEGLTFKWFKYDNLIPGATNSTYTVTSENGDYYSVEVNDEGCLSMGDIYIQFNSPPTVNYSPSPLIVCDSGSDGYAFFNLHDADADITLGNGTLTVTYHPTDLDAQANLNVLINPFMNEEPYNDIVYARVEGPNGCYSIVILDLIIRNSPTLIEPSPLQLCDESLNGLQVFDLSTKEVEMLDTMDPLQYDFYYFENELDAISAGQSALNAPDFSAAIPNPTSYQNTTPFQQTIYVLAVGNATNAMPYNGGQGCFDILPLQLMVEELPAITQPIDLVEEDEDGDGFSIFDLTENDAIVLAGLDSSEYNISYFETQADAELDSNNITDPMNYQNIQNPQTIYVRVENISTECFEIDSFLISTEYLSLASFGFENLYLFPNPTSESFTIHSNQLKAETTISLYDILGKTLLSDKILPKNGSISLDVSSFQSGVYFVKISSEGNVAVRKLIIE